MSKEDVTHRGVIESVGRNSLTIRTEEACKCDGCAITALCNTKGGGHELLTIDTPLASDFNPGEPGGGYCQLRLYTEGQRGGR